MVTLGSWYNVTFQVLNMNFLPIKCVLQSRSFEAHPVWRKEIFFTGGQAVYQMCGIDVIFEVDNLAAILGAGAQFNRKKFGFSFGLKNHFSSGLQ